MVGKCLKIRTIPDNKLESARRRILNGENPYLVAKELGLWLTGKAKDEWQRRLAIMHRLARYDY